MDRLIRNITLGFPTAVLKKVRYAHSPMPYAVRVPDLSEKGYTLILFIAIRATGKRSDAAAWSGLRKVLP